jgi:hypothetical protein
MGHGAWMGIAWGNIEDGQMGRNITPEMLHVSVGGRFQGSCLEAHVSWCVIFD